MKIFLAEDKESLEKTLSILKERGDDIETTTDGVSCLEKIYASKPNLLILNAFLPELDGHQLCYLLRGDEKYSGIPIILIEPADKSVFIDPGLNIEGRIKKPLKKDEFFHLIDEISKKKGVSGQAQIEFEKLTLELSKKEKEIQELKSSMERFKISKEALIQVNSLLNKQIQEITFVQKIGAALSFSFMDINQTNEVFFNIAKEAFPIDTCFCLVLDNGGGRLYVKGDTLFSEGLYDELYNAISNVFPNFEREKVRVSKGGMFITQEGTKKPQLFLVSSLPCNEKNIILAVSREKPFDPKEKGLFEKIAKYAKLGFTHAIFFEELERTFFNTMTALIETMEGKQKYQAGHSGRVAQYARSICETLGLSKEDTNLICDAALLHDIGKMNVPDEILNKPGKLTKEEFATLKLHPRMAEDVLRSFKTFQNMLPIICYHHEKFGGGGYGRLKGDQIPLGARILAVCDAFDAMLSDRPYRKALTPDAALAELREGIGSQFDPLIIKAFLKMWLEKKIEIPSHPTYALT